MSSVVELVEVPVAVAVPTVGSIVVSSGMSTETSVEVEVEVPVVRTYEVWACSDEEPPHAAMTRHTEGRRSKWRSRRRVIDAVTVA